MCNIFLCDKNEQFSEYLTVLINDIKPKYSLQPKIYKYDSAKSVINALMNGIECDLLIIDINMFLIKECITFFRSKYKDSVLVFCSQSQILSADNLRYQPYRMISKTSSKEHIALELNEILNKLSKERKHYIVSHYRNNIARVELNDINYIENAKRGSRIIIVNNKKNMYDSPLLVDKKLSELQKCYDELIPIHNSYIVNIDNIKQIKDNDVVMNDGTLLSISRKYKKDFINFFMNI